MWNKEALHDLIETKLKDYQLIVVANREPYIHQHTGKRIECIFPASGMATALDPIMRACGASGSVTGAATQIARRLMLTIMCKFRPTIRATLFGAYG